MGRWESEGKPVRRFAGISVASLVAALALASPVTARTFTVNDAGDHEPDGCTARDCTLREAVLGANQRPGADVIVLRSGRVHRLERAGRGEDNSAVGDLDVRERVEIRASGRRRAIVDAAGLDRAFDAFARLTLRRIEVRRGDPFAPGTGVRATDANLALRDVTVRGGSGFGVAILQSGNWSVIGSNVVVGPNDGGGVREEGPGRLILARSHVHDNGGNGLQEFDAGSIDAEGTVIERNAGFAASEAGPGSLIFDGGTARRNTGAGLAESGDGQLRARRARVLDNGGFGMSELELGGLSAQRATVSRNLGFGVSESGAGSLRFVGGARSRTAGSAWPSPGTVICGRHAPSSRRAPLTASPRPTAARSWRRAPCWRATAPPAPRRLGREGSICAADRPPATPAWGCTSSTRET